MRDASCSSLPTLPRRRAKGSRPRSRRSPSKPFARWTPSSCWNAPSKAYRPRKQKADNAGDNDEENRADHHAAHGAEQHDDQVGLIKQHPDRRRADEGANDAGDRETPGKPDVTPLTHVYCVAAPGDRRDFSTGVVASRRMAALQISLVLLTTFLRGGKPQAEICGGYQQGDFVEWGGCATKPRGIAGRAVSFSTSPFVRCAVAKASSLRHCS